MPMNIKHILTMIGNTETKRMKINFWLNVNQEVVEVREKQVGVIDMIEDMILGWKVYEV